MQTKRSLLLLLLLLSTISVFDNSSSAQIVRDERGSSFKWVLVSDKTSGEYGAETPNGKVLIPMGKHFVIFHESNGGYFELCSNGLVAVYSTEGKELIPIIENSIGSDEMLSEVVDVVNDINSFENENCDWSLLDKGDESIYDFEYPNSYNHEDLMVAAIQEPLELNIETPPLDIPDDIDIGDDGMDGLFDL